MRTRELKTDCGAKPKKTNDYDKEQQELIQKIAFGKELKIVFVNDGSCYYPFKNFLNGKMVRVLRITDYGKVCEFVREDDRQRMNAEAGWSDRKKEYLFDGVKLR